MAASRRKANELREAVRGYAANLCDFLKQGLGVITAAQALPASRDVYQSAMLAKHELHDAVNWRREETTGHGRPDLDHQSSNSSESEDRTLHEWITEGFRKPLLIVAPAGSGKSCLLESLALRLAMDLLSNDKWPADQRWPPVVPVIVPLHKVVSSGLALADYVYMAEQKLFEDLLPRAPRLTPEVLDALGAEGKLAFLVDGYDEVPRDYRGKLATQVKALRNFALTSRPGHGAESIIEDHTRHRTLVRISNEAAHNYVKAYFLPRSSGRFSWKDAIQLFEKSRRGTLAPMLNRPLYLKTWCDFVSMGEHRPPRSIAELADQQLKNLFHSRELLIGLGIHEREKALKQFAPWFGRMGVYFADHGFRSQPHSALVERHLFEDAADTLSIGADKTVIDVAVDSGLLIYKDETSEYWLPSVPLVEYLIGNYLAEDARLTPHAPTCLIETFRRWIWRMRLHDTLDYTFDALWHGTSDQRRWANGLLHWAVEAGRHDAARLNRLDRAAQDDLVRPFAQTAMRWHCLNTQPTRSELIAGQEIATEVAQLRAIVREEVACNQEIVSAPFVGERLITPLVTTLIEDQCHLPLDADAQLRWLRSIAATARRVREEDAPTVVRLWIDEHVGAVSHEGARVAWWWAIEAAASRIRKIEAATKIREWIAEQNQRTQGDSPRWAWQCAISAAASRVPKEEATNILRTLIDEHNRPSSDDFAKWRWERAIAAVANVVPEEDAADIVRSLIEEGIATATTKCEHHPVVVVWHALQYAAPRVRETDAARVVRQWMLERQRAANDEDRRWAWGVAISWAVGRVLAKDAREIVRELIADHFHDNRDDDFSRQWWGVIEGAAGRVREDEAGEVIRELIAECISRELDGDDTSKWWLVIESVARRVREEDARQIVSELIAEYSRQDGDANSQCWGAIKQVAGRVCEDEADKMVRDLVEQYERALTDEDVILECGFAISAAAGRIRVNEARRLVRTWVAEWNHAMADGGAALAWYWAIWSASARVHKDEAAAFIRERVEEYNRTTHELQGKSLYANAVATAASRLPEEDAAEVVLELIAERDRMAGDDGPWTPWDSAISTAAHRIRSSDEVDVCRRLIASSDTKTAFEIAANGAEVAIISEMDVDVYGEPLVDGDNPRLRYAAMPRESQDGCQQLVLDHALVAAPPLIRMALLRRSIDSLKGERDGTPSYRDLAKSCDLREEIRRLRGEIELLRDQGEFEAELIERGASLDELERAISDPPRAMTGLAGQIGTPSTRPALQTQALPPSRRKAYGQFLEAVQRNPELANARDNEVYYAVKEGLEDGEALPKFETWSKYLREARSYFDTNKHRPRAGRRHGKSIVKRDEI